MSKIKVNDIAPSSSNTPSITLGTNSNVTFANGVTATSFTGDGANLTNVPAPSTFNAANLTGALPALDGANLTNVGGGSLEFVSKTTISSNTAQVDFTGLDYGFIYKIVGKRLLFSGQGGQYPELAPFVNGATSPITNSACTYNQINRDVSNSGSAYGYTAFQFYDGGYWQAKPFAFSAEFSTDYYPRLDAKGFSYHDNAYSICYLNGHFNSNIISESNVSAENTVRISGMRFKSSSGWQITSGEILVYKYKES